MGCKTNRYDNLEIIRHKVLAALDDGVREIYANVAGRPPLTNTPGATDADLPELFKAIDRQADRALARLGIELDEELDHPSKASPPI